MRKFFENSISLLVALVSLGLCIQWYRNTGEIEPLIGIIASAGALLTAVVYRIFPEKKEAPAVYSDGVAPSHHVTMEQTKNAVSDSDVQAGRDLHIGDTTNNYIQQFVNYDGHQIPRALTPAPFDPPIFIGREQTLLELRKKLLAGQHLLLLVNGQGGMGKTSFAAKYWLRYQKEYKHLAFLYVGDGIVSPMLSMANTLGLSFPETMPEAERFPLLLHKLATLEETCLLVLDNANDDRELEKHFQALHRLPNFHVLLTSRLEKVQETESMKIGELPDDFPLQLFKTHYPKHRPEDDALFWGIFHAVGGNTLVLEVLAKNLREINGDEEFYSLSDLLNDLQGRNLLHLSAQSRVKVQWQDMAKAEPAQILEAMYDLRPLEREELRVLSNLAVLPPENIAYETLKLLLSPDKPRELSAALMGLHRKGWLERSETQEGMFYKINPVVQEVVRVKNEGIQEDCQILINVLVNELSRDKIHDDNYGRSTLFLRYGESATSLLQKPDYMLALLNERTGAFYTSIGNLGKAMFCFDACKNVSLKLCELEPDTSYHKDELAISYCRLGDIQFRLGSLDRALAFFELYCQLEIDLYKAYPHNVDFKNGLAISFCKLGETYSALSYLDRALAYFEHYHQLEKELYEADPQNIEIKYVLANSYCKLGETYSEMGYLDRALAYFEHYHQLEKELYGAYPQNTEFKNGLAISYLKLGEINSALGNLEHALFFFKEETRFFEELYKVYPQNVGFKNGVAVSYSKLGVFYRDHQKDPSKARPYFHLSYTLWKELSEAHPTYAEFTKNFNWAKEDLEET